jgi:hypothetical protein
MPSHSTCVILVTFLTLLAGCRKQSEKIAVYSSPKDAPPATMPVADSGAGAPIAPAVAGDAPAGSPLAWTVPDGWKELPGSAMRFASFQVSDNPPLQLSVTPLGMEAGDPLSNVNRWEQQLGLPPTPAEKLDSVIKKVPSNGLEISTVDLTGPESATPRARMLAAMLPAGGQIWFFKLTGPLDAVAAQKEKFDTFIRSLKPADATAPPAQAAPLAAPVAQAPAAGAHAPVAGQSMKLAKFTAGAGWTEIPGSKAPRMVAYDMGEGEKKAQLIVTRFNQNSTGSFLDNINRWRTQIGLPAVADTKGVEMADTAAGKERAVMITLDNPGGAGAAAKRMLVAIAIVGPDCWFFKLTGAPETVEKEKAALDAFLKSLEFSPE